MARLEMNNSMTTYIRDLEKLADDTPQLCKEMLNAEADVVEPALRAAIASKGLVDTGTLQSAIGRSSRKNGRELLVGPSGYHHSYVPKSGPARRVRAGHVGYIHEYGAPQQGIRPKKWMRSTIAQVRSKALNAAEAAHDKFLRDNNL